MAWFLIWLLPALLGAVLVATRKLNDEALRKRQLLAVIIWPLSLAGILFLLASELVFGSHADDDAASG